MIYQIEFADGVDRQISKFKKSQPSAFKKLVTLLGELGEHPRTGTGHPEPLRGGDGVTWSRKITKKDRLVYDIFDEVVTVTVIQVGNHYNDK